LRSALLFSHAPVIKEISNAHHSSIDDASARHGLGPGGECAGHDRDGVFGQHAGRRRQRRD
jgi:hypothetical protein